MKRLSLLTVLCLAAACAHAPQDVPVRVIVNASDGAAGRVDTAALQRVTENIGERVLGFVTYQLAPAADVDGLLRFLRIRGASGRSRHPDARFQDAR